MIDSVFQSLAVIQHEPVDILKTCLTYVETSYMKFLETSNKAFVINFLASAYEVLYIST